MAGFGHYVPDRRVRKPYWSGGRLEPGWIERRTPRHSERQWAAPDETLTDIAMMAGKMALDDAGLALPAGRACRSGHIRPTNFTAFSTLLLPSLVSDYGPDRSGCGYCSGFLCALVLADGFVKNTRKPVLVVTANILSRVSIWRNELQQSLCRCRTGAVPTRAVRQPA